MTKGVESAFFFCDSLLLSATDLRKSKFVIFLDIYLKNDETISISEFDEVALDLKVSKVRNCMFHSGCSKAHFECW